jgi:predicted nucleotide-binding protein
MAHRDTDGANESAKLEPVHQRIIDLAHNHWLKENDWPEPVQVKMTLRSEGFDYNEIESNKLAPYIKGWGDKIELTILGLQAAKGSAEWMAHFVALVNQSVERYLEDPKGRPVVNDAHLAAIANDWSQEKLRRYGEIYRDWISTLGGVSSSDKDGHWIVELGPNCIRYIGLKSITDFASRRRDYKHATLKDGLTPGQRKMAVWCIRRWRTPDGAPAALDVVLHHVGVVENPLDAWESMPQEVFDDARVYADPPQPIKPRFGGLLALRPETDEDLLSFWKVTRSVRDLYLDKKAPSEVSIADVAEGAELSEEDVVRLADLTHTTVPLLYYSNSRQGEQFISTRQRLLDLDGIDSLDGLLNYLDEQQKEMEDREVAQMATETKKVFVVHGHDDSAREAVARFLSRLDLEPIILHEQPDQGQTIVEKFEANSDVAFAVVLLTPDDVGAAKSTLPHWPFSTKEHEVRAARILQERARQNVVLELGYFMGKLGRRKVCALKKGNIEIPTDYSGVIWKSMDDSGWQTDLAKEMKAAGLDVDMNKL